MCYIGWPLFFSIFAFVWIMCWLEVVHKKLASFQFTNCYLKIASNYPVSIGFDQCIFLLNRPPDANIFIFFVLHLNSFILSVKVSIISSIEVIFTFFMFYLNLHFLKDIFFNWIDCFEWWRFDFIIFIIINDFF